MYNEVDNKTKGNKIMKKSSWFLVTKIFVFTALFLLCAVFASAEGTVGEYSWSVSEGTLTVSGEGSGVLVSETSPWAELADGITNVVIEADITSVDGNIFACLAKLKTVSIPKNLDVSTVAFSDEVESLTFVSYPTCAAATSVRELMKSSDKEIKLAYDPTLARSGERTEKEAFTWVFDDATGKLTITSSVTSGYSANLCLDNRSSIYAWKQIWRDAILHIETVTSASGGMIYCHNYGSEFFFANMPNLISIKMDSGYTNIQDNIAGGIFEGNPSLTTLGWGSNFKDGEINIKGWQYWTVQEPTALFKGCSSITKVVFRTSSIANSNGKVATPYIFSSMFEGCTSLKSITLPSYITTVKSNAFKDCTALEEINIHSGVTTFGANAFANCTALENITVEASSIEANGQVFDDREGLVVVCPTKETVNSFKTAYAYSDTKIIALSLYSGTIGDYTWNIDSDGVLKISGEGSGVLTCDGDAPWAEYALDISSVVFDAEITSVKNDLFASLVNPTVIYISEALDVSDWVLSDECEKITFVTYPTSVAAASVRNLIKSSEANIVLSYDADLTRTGAEGKYTWSFDDESGKLTFNATTTGWVSITYSSTSAFKAWKAVWRDAIISIDFVNFSYDALYNNSSADECIFANLPNLESAHLKGITEIKEQAPSGFFSGCSSLETVSFNSTLTSGTVSLKGWTHLTGGNLNSMFEGCSSVTKVVFTTNPLKNGDTEYTYVYVSMFEGCTALQSIEIPAYITQIRADAFKDCSSLKNVDILGENLTSIDETSFPDLERLVINVINSEIAELFTGYEYTEVVYPGKFYNALSMDGFSVRIASYNGMRGLFSIDKDLISANEEKGYMLVEYGTLVAAAENRANCVISSDSELAKGVVRKVFWNSEDGLVGKYLSDSAEKTEFAVTVINFEEKNYCSDVYFCAYEIWQDSDGKEKVIYTDCAGTDYDEISLYDISYEMWRNGAVTEEMDKDGIVRGIINAVPLEGKRIIFIGNSHIFYGNTVLRKDATDTLTQEGRMNDKGYFYQLCKANGINVNVTNWTIGNHLFDDFFSGSCSANRGCDGVDHASYLTDRYYDYVIACYGTKGHADYIEWLDVMIDFFKEANPNVKFYLMAQSSAHGIDNRATGPDEVFLKSLKTLGEKDISVIDWGKIIADIVNGEVYVPGATLEYNKNTFVVNQSANDGYHPNQLTGYITTLMTYSIITGESAVGQPYYFCGDDSYSSDYQYRTFDEFISTYYTYNGATTNYDKVFASEVDMTGLQTLVDRYIAAKYYLEY